MTEFEPTYVAVDPDPTWITHATLSWMTVAIDAVTGHGTVEPVTTIGAGCGDKDDHQYQILPHRVQIATGAIFVYM